MSPNKIIITVSALILLTAVGLAASTLLTPPAKTAPTAPTSAASYENARLGLAFTYKDDTTGYVLEERPTDQSAGAPIATITLTPYEDYQRMQTNPPIGGEGPAGIAVNVFANTEKQFPLAWAMARPEYSGYNLKISPDEELVVGGANALSYTADGLYPARYVIVAHGSYMYVFTGQYLDPDSNLRRDFDALLPTIRFVPEAVPTGKIDAKVACESALAYMTFPDGASADAFVADCIEGKHPEVFERYRQDQGMDAAAM